MFSPTANGITEEQQKSSDSVGTTRDEGMTQSSTESSGGTLFNLYNHTGHQKSWLSLVTVQKVSKYKHEMPQAHTADQPMGP